MVVKCSIIPMIDQGPICSLTKHQGSGLNAKFWKHSPFGRVTPKMYSPAPVFTRQKLYAHPLPPPNSPS